MGNDPTEPNAETALTEGELDGVTGGTRNVPRVPGHAEAPAGGVAIIRETPLDTSSPLSKPHRL